MKATLDLRGAGLLLGASSLVLLGASLLGASHSTPQDPSGVPAVLQPDQCYRLAFSVAASPNYKVLARLDRGWIKAEVDAGPASDKRQPLWINTAQIITVREARCSD